MSSADSNSWSAGCKVGLIVGVGVVALALGACADTSSTAVGNARSADPQPVPNYDATIAGCTFKGSTPSAAAARVINAIPSGVVVSTATDTLRPLGEYGPISPGVVTTPTAGEAVLGQEWKAFREGTGEGGNDCAAVPWGMSRDGKWLNYNGHEDKDARKWWGSIKNYNWAPGPEGAVQFGVYSDLGMSGKRSGAADSALRENIEARWSSTRYYGEVDDNLSKIECRPGKKILGCYTKAYNDTLWNGGTVGDTYVYARAGLILVKSSAVDTAEEPVNWQVAKASTNGEFVNKSDPSGTTVPYGADDRVTIATWGPNSGSHTSSFTLRPKDGDWGKKPAPEVLISTNTVTQWNSDGKGKCKGHPPANDPCTPNGIPNFLMPTQPVSGKAAAGKPGATQDSSIDCRVVNPTAVQISCIAVPDKSSFDPENPVKTWIVDIKTG